MRKNSNFLRHLTLNLCLIFLVGFLSSNLWAEKKQLPTINQQEAIDAAIAMTGFDRLPDISIKAQHEVLEQDNTPVIGTEIANCPIWRITFENIKLRLPQKEEPSPNPYIHAFDVLVDGTKGQVLKIVSHWPPEATPEERAPAERARVEREKQMNYKEQRYEKVPMNETNWPPKVKFLEALEIVSTQGPGPRLSETKRIEGLYFLYSSPWPVGPTEDKLFRCPFGKPCPVWLINLYGIRFRSHYTSFYHRVHAMKGLWMGGGAPAK